MAFGDLLHRATAGLEEGIDAPRAMLVFAHVDDEVIALGARLGRFGSAHLVHVTDSAPRNGEDARAHGFASVDEYREARAAELDAALTLAGIPQVSRDCLGIPDQEASLALTRATVALIERFESYTPEVVFTHPYEGGHPDHDACAFAVHRAVALLCEQGRHAPLIIEAPSYHQGPQGIATGAFLPSPHAVEEREYVLSDGERVRKQALFACFATQREVLSSFGTDVERFRVAPHYDFTTPPHQPPVFYDSFNWGMTSERFSQLARETQSELERTAVEALCR